MYAQGNITLGGNLIIGDVLTQDTVTFSANVNSNIVPNLTDTHSLGSNNSSGGNEWHCEYSAPSAAEVLADGTEPAAPDGESSATDPSAVNDFAGNADEENENGAPGSSLFAAAAAAAMPSDDHAPALGC